MSEEHELKQPEQPAAAQTDETGAAPAEATEETDPTFVAESSKPGRNATLLLATLVILGAGGLYVMHLKAGPRTAAANAETKAANTTINEFLSDGGKNLQAMRDLLRNTEKIVEQFMQYPGMKQVSLEDLKGNPFRFAGGPNDSAEQARTRAERERDKEQAHIQEDAAKLKLQSVLAGHVRVCMISGKTYTEGQRIGGFVIEKIAQDHVVVMHESSLTKDKPYRFELRMQK